MMIKKVIIPAAGLGTRLLTSTKETPKEMLPIFSGNRNELCIKPTLQVIFEQLYEFGFRDYCIIVGRGKRAIEDHFTPDSNFLEKISKKKKQEISYSLEQFYKMMDDSNILWVNQPYPHGFGDAVLRSKPFIHDEPFIVHAGDTVILSKNNNHFSRLVSGFTDNSCSILLQKVKNGKQYGIAEIQKKRERFVIKSVEEKPIKPKSPWAIMPLYIFDSLIFDALNASKVGQSRELQLTTGIQRLIDLEKKVIGIPMIKNEKKLDIGTPEMYWDSLNISYKNYYKKSLNKNLNK